MTLWDCDILFCEQYIHCFYCSVEYLSNHGFVNSRKLYNYVIKVLKVPITMTWARIFIHYMLTNEVLLVFNTQIYKIDKNKLENFVSTCSYLSF